jgi:hypothetical protein
MIGETVTRFAVKRGDLYITKNSYTESFWGPISEAKLWREKPDFSLNVKGDKIVMVSVTTREQEYEVTL